MISGILLILFLCAVEWIGAYIALEANPQAKREYYNKNDPFKTLFMKQ
jgi:hypothetical protein